MSRQIKPQRAHGSGSALIRPRDSGGRTHARRYCRLRSEDSAIGRAFVQALSGQIAHRSPRPARRVARTAQHMLAAQTRTPRDARHSRMHNMARRTRRKVSEGPRGPGLRGKRSLAIFFFPHNVRIVSAQPSRSASHGPSTCATSAATAPVAIGNARGRSLTKPTTRRHRSQRTTSLCQHRLWCIASTIAL